MDRPKVISDATLEYKDDEDDVLEFMRETYINDTAMDDDHDYIYCVKVVDAYKMYKAGKGLESLLFICLLSQHYSNKSGLFGLTA
jgi:predicted Ser/Thr protein kinase